MTKRLNIGCGVDIKKGYVNLDRCNLPGVDVVHDLEKLPLPFNDNEFDEILCQDVLEHVEYISLMAELYRILKNGGALFVRVPHFTSANNYIDPTHKNMFSFRLFDYFVKENNMQGFYYFDFHFTRIRSRKITLPKNYYLHNYFVEPVINISDITRRIYESTFLSRLFPAENILVEMVK